METRALPPGVGGYECVGGVIYGAPGYGGWGSCTASVFTFVFAFALAFGIGLGSGFFLDSSCRIIQDRIGRLFLDVDGIEAWRIGV